jgi:hypothetical protein
MGVQKIVIGLDTKRFSDFGYGTFALSHGNEVRLKSVAFQILGQVCEEFAWNPGPSRPFLPIFSSIKR